MKQNKKPKLMLISSSYCEGGSYLEHVARAIKEFIGPLNFSDIIAFIPYALKDHDSYTKKARAAFEALGYRNLFSVHEADNPRSMLKHPNVKVIFIGGGNTHRLLKGLYKNDLIKIIQSKVKNGGVKYIGTSAGSNVACPTIKTTNDMPIVQLRSLRALNLIDFQINVHFVPGSLVPNHMGETREKRIEEFHEENNTPVVGLPETNWIETSEVNNHYVLCGKNPAIVFQKNKDWQRWETETPLWL